MQQVVILGRQKRIAEGVKVKTPLKTLKVVHQDQELLDEMKKLEEYIKTELNVKDLEYLTNESDFVVLSAKPNLPVLGKKLGKEMGAYKALIEKLSSTDVQKVENGETITLKGKEFGAEEVLVQRNAKPGTAAMTNKLITIDMNCTLDQDLIDEGLAREMVNRIQKTRKDSNFNVADRIAVEIHTTENLQRIFEHYQGYITSETLIERSGFSKSSLPGSVKHEIDDEVFEVKAIKA